MLTRLELCYQTQSSRGVRGYEARIDLPEQGLSLIFLPEGPKTGKLALAAVQFVSDAEEGFKTFV